MTYRRSASSGTPSRASRKVSEPHFVILLDFRPEIFGFSCLDSLSVLVAAHASLDEYMATWFGLDQSKYQWALNDYYETIGKVSKVSDLRIRSSSTWLNDRVIRENRVRSVSFRLRCRYSNLDLYLG